MKTQSCNLTLALGMTLALALGSVAAGATSESQAITDARQETQIWTTYALSPYLRANNLKVSVRNGKATLSGVVEEDVSKDLAKQIALGVEGITEVDNLIAVEPDYRPAKVTAERSYGELIDDATITAKVKSKLIWSKHTSGFAIDVDTKAGKVTLAGEVASDAAKELAGRLAMNTRDVVSVNNDLVVEPEDSGMISEAGKSVMKMGDDIADSWITAKVKSTFIYSSNVDSADISVTTNNGVVTLTGKVGSGAERALAIELAQNIRGVKSVQSTNLKY